MTKILYVYGDDYAAVDFEKLRDSNIVDPAELWYIAYMNGEQEYVTERQYFQYSAYEFGKVDPKFIEFIKAERDYDHAKSANFYVIGGDNN